MKTIIKRGTAIAAGTIFAALCMSCGNTIKLSAVQQQHTVSDFAPLTIAKQGTFTAGGKVTVSPGTYDPHTPFNPQGQTIHDGHASVFYQIPSQYNGHNMVFLHGFGQTRVGWQTTADGREGFDTMFQRKGYGVYLIDQPGRGAAAQTAAPAANNGQTLDQNWITQFRTGYGYTFFEGTQFPHDDNSLDQFYRQMVPDTGLYSPDEISDAVAAVFEKAGSGILVTHSAGGAPGWWTAIKSDKVEAVIAIEPGAWFFPENELPEPIPNRYTAMYGNDLTGTPVSESEFAQLIKQPVIVYYGDYIPAERDDVPAEDFWRAQLIMAREWAKVVNAHGGDATVIHLPEIGINGNTHFIFSDLNNKQIFEHICNWLKEKKL